MDAALEKTYRPREAWLPYSRAFARRPIGGGRCGRERPAEVGGRGLQAGAREEFAPSYDIALWTSILSSTFRRGPAS